MPIQTSKEQRRRYSRLLEAVYFSKNLTQDEILYLSVKLHKMAVMEMLEGSCDSFLGAFYWDTTAEGFQYWNRIHQLTKDHFHPAKKPGMSSDVQEEDLRPII